MARAKGVQNNATTTGGHTLAAGPHRAHRLVLRGESMRKLRATKAS